MNLGVYPTTAVDLGGDLSGFRGAIHIVDGTVRVTRPGALNTTSRVVFGDAISPRLELNAATATIGSLDSSNVAAAIDLGGNLVGSALVVGADNSNGFYAGMIAGSNGGLVKIGTGQQTLSGPLTYFGPTIVREGRLAIAHPMDPGSFFSGNVRVESGGELSVQATINRPIAGVGAASVIAIHTQAAVSLGDASSFLGFSNQGELRVGLGSVTVNSAGAARLGGWTKMGGFTGPFFDIPTPGSLSIPNGAIVDFGEAITGFGTITTPNTLAKRVVVNGVAQGDSATNRLTFTGYVKGTGSFDNVTFTGTFSPGLSPAVVEAGDVRLTDTSILEMEIGGLARGAQYDGLDVSGTLQLDGTLKVSFLSGYAPAAGDTWQFFNGNVVGAFDGYQLPTLAAGLSWDVSQLTTTGPASVVAGLIADFNSDGAVDGADFLKWQRGQSPHPNSAGDLANWRANFRSVSAVVAANAAVPEPTTLTLAILAALRRVRRGKGQD